MNQFLYTAYAVDTTIFSLNNKNSVTDVIQVFEQFSNFSGLKPHKSKCEIVGIGVPKGVRMAPCGMECVKHYQLIFQIT